MPLSHSPIETERLILRPFTGHDFAALYSLHSLPEVAEFMYWAPRSREEVWEALAKRVRNAVAVGTEPEELEMAVALRSDGVLIGETNLNLTSRANRQGEVGFVLHPGYQGNGYGTEAVAATLTAGFARFGLHRIFGRCNARNHASARLMERLGMRLEAHLRQSELVKGVWCDVFEYAVLASEWPGTQRNGQEG
jgi:RimJ/RimL family protein N-acetyltransferase